MLRAETNAPFPNRIQLILDPLVGPFVQNGPLGDFNPTRDLQVYVDGDLVVVQTFTFDEGNNRYLLYTNQAINLQGVIQVLHHMPSPPFMCLYQAITVLSAEVTGSPADMVMLTAVVSTAPGLPEIESAPEGTVQFYDGGNALGGPITVVGGEAMYNTSSLSVGTHYITAIFSPTGTVYAVGTSNLVVIMVI